MARSLRFKLNNPYIIIWRDHYQHASDNAWVDKTEINADAAYVITLGYVTASSKKSVAISGSVGVGSDTQVSAPMVILRECIEYSIDLSPIQKEIEELGLERETSGQAEGSSKKNRTK